MDGKKTILVLAGDGIGPECMNEALRVIDWFDIKLSINFEVSEDYIGGAAYDIYGTCLTKETMRKAELADAIQQVQREAQERQAEEVPAGAPESMPGLAQPGAGAEAMPAPPQAGQPSLRDLLAQVG